MARTSEQKNIVKAPPEKPWGSSLRDYRTKGGTSTKKRKDSETSIAAARKKKIKKGKHINQPQPQLDEASDELHLLAKVMAGFRRDYR